MELRLILGDQLNAQHSWFKKPQSDVTYVLMQVRSETDYCQHHVQKVVGIFMAMSAFAQKLRAAGHQVVCIEVDDPSNQHAILPNLQRIIADQLEKSDPVIGWRYQHPDEYRVDIDLANAAKVLQLPLVVDDSEHFLSNRDGFDGIFEQNAKSLRMETFYRAMRQRHNILLNSDGSPCGGTWNFDHHNRSAYDNAIAIPESLNFPENFVGSWPSRLQRLGIKTIGSIGSNLDWPITREQGLATLNFFIKNLLAYFGRYQDALVHGNGHLFHSRLSFALNLKLIHPGEVIACVELAYVQGRADIASCEGFIRQILGWREYVRCFYWRLYPALNGRNDLSHINKLPSWFWTGQTRMECLSEAITQSLKTGYAHHIQRLMVTGNFMVLAGVNPKEVNAWYLGIYVDAIEWVQWPNTHAMSQYAEGGHMASKPYVSSGAYIHKQGDHCRYCHYSVKEKIGENACPFNALYWDFINRHEAIFAKNPRMALVVKQWQKRAIADKHAVLKQAESVFARMESL